MIDAQIKAIGPLISLTLALVVVFTNQRQDVARRRGDELRWRWRFVRAALLDVALLVVTALATAATASLGSHALRHPGFPHTSGALRSLFALVWLSLLGLVAWQAAMVVQTLAPTWRTRGIPWRKPRDD